jgi:hypothetical protein
VDGMPGQVRAELDADQLQALIATLEAAQQVRQTCTCDDTVLPNPSLR